jgi:hypothetical protein
MTPTINELSINNDYLKEEIENNKELYKNAPMKAIVALVNLKQKEITSLKKTADAYKKANEQKKKNLLAVLQLLGKDNAKHTKYVVDYFKFMAGIE